MKEEQHIHNTTTDKWGGNVVRAVIGGAITGGMSGLGAGLGNYAGEYLGSIVGNSISGTAGSIVFSHSLLSSFSK